MSKFQKFIIWTTAMLLVLNISHLTGFLGPEKAEAASTGIFYPTAGVDKTSATYNLTSNDLNKLKFTDNQYYESDGNWPKNASDYNETEYIEFSFSPNIASDAKINSVSLTHVYKNTTSNFLSAAKLEVYNNSTKIGEQIIAVPSVKNPEITTNLNLKVSPFFVDTPSEINALKVRFLAYVSDNHNIKSKHDLLKLQVNYNQPPTAPTLVSPTDREKLNDNTPTFDWDEATDPDDDELIYEIQVDNNNDFSSPEWSEASLSDTTVTLPDGNALKDGTYFWRVRAYDRQDYGDFSVIRSFMVDTDSISSIINFPQSDMAYNDVSWQNVISGTASDDFGSGVAKVEVLIYDQTANLWWKEGSGWTNTKTPNSATGTEVWFFNFPKERLTNNHQYTIRSLATDKAGNEQPEPTEAVNVLYDTESPPAVTSFSATSKEGYVYLSWNPVDDAEYYEISRASSDFVVIATVPGDQTSYIDYGVQQGKSYTYKIIAVDKAGNKSQTALVSITVPKAIALISKAKAAAPEVIEEVAPPAAAQEVKPPVSEEGKILGSEEEKETTNWTPIIVLGALIILVLVGYLGWRWYAKHEPADRW